MCVAGPTQENGSNESDNPFPAGRLFSLKATAQIRQFFILAYP